MHFPYHYYANAYYTNANDTNSNLLKTFLSAISNYSYTAKQNW